MYAGQPEENLFFILLMAAILLALFWNDKISGDSGSSTTSTTTSTGSRTDDTGSGSSGGARDTGKGSGDGKDTVKTSDTGRDPFVRVKEQVDSRNGAFKLRAEAKARGDSEIVATGFIKMSHYPTGKKLIDVDSPEKSDYLNRGNTYELEKKGVGVGAVQYTAWTKDSEGRTGTYSDNFEIKPVDGGGDGGGDGSGSGGSGPDIDIEYGADGDGGPDSGGGSTGTPDGGANPPNIMVEVDTDEDKVGARASDFNVVSEARSNSGEELDALEVEFIWPNGSKNEREIELSGKSFRETDLLSSTSFLDADFILSMDGTYRVKLTVMDAVGNSSSDYDQIVINDRSSDSSMSASSMSFEDLHKDQDLEISQLHGALEELNKIHEDHEEELELETNILNEGKNILKCLNSLESVEKEMKHILTAEVKEDVHNMGQRQLESKSEEELEEMANEAELKKALLSAISDTNFETSAFSMSSVDDSDDLQRYLQSLEKEMEEFQSTFNTEVNYQDKDNELLQHLEQDVGKAVNLHNKQLHWMRHFVKNANAPK